MEVIIKNNYSEMSLYAAQIVANKIRTKPKTVLGLATGSTPLGLYNELIKLHKIEGLDFSNVISFNLDEYVGLSKDHPQSYKNFMDNKLFSKINIKQKKEPPSYKSYYTGLWSSLSWCKSKRRYQKNDRRKKINTWITFRF